MMQGLGGPYNCIEILPVTTPMFRARQVLKEFRAAVAREFAFLATDFGFAEERVRRPANEFSVWFVNATTRVIVE